jgi:hypothetical protein
MLWSCGSSRNGCATIGRSQPSQRDMQRDKSELEAGSKICRIWRPGFHQCCGPENFFFYSDPEFFPHIQIRTRIRIRIWIRIRILRLIFWHDNSKEWLSLLAYVQYSETCKTEKKFCYRKNILIPFKCLTLGFFLNCFYFKTKSGFVFGRNLRIISDSDQQH